MIVRGRNLNIGGRTNPSNTRGNSSGRGNNQISTQNQYQGQWSDKSSIKCHYCKKYGHYIHECRKKQYDSRQQNENFIKENQNHGACFYLATLHKKIRRIYGF
jgi:hypothetical protein